MKTLEERQLEQKKQKGKRKVGFTAEAQGRITSEPNLSKASLHFHPSSRLFLQTAGEQLGGVEGGIIGTVSEVDRDKL